jgi:hypothetical protein
MMKLIINKLANLLRDIIDAVVAIAISIDLGILLIL